MNNVTAFHDVSHRNSDASFFYHLRCMSSKRP